MTVAPDPDEYFEHVLRHAVPWDERRPTTDVDRWRAWWADRPRPTPVHELARRQGWVVSTAQLRRLGFADHDVRRQVRRGAWWAPARGVLSPVDVRADDAWVQRRREHALRSTAAALSRPEHVVDGRSAAILYGLPTTEVPALPELAGPASTGRRRRVHVHALRLRIPEITTWYGTAVATQARVVVDLARRCADDGIMAADAALRAGLVTVASLAAALDSSAGWPGVRRAREVLTLMSALSESPLESVTRLRLHDDGFPVPELQAEIAGYAVDIYWPEYGVALECDGRGKYTADELWRERRRTGRLRAAGVVEVERVVWSDVNADWPETRSRLAALFPSGVVKIRAGK